MTDNYDTPEMISKEITLSAMSKVGFSVGEGTPDKVGNKYGKLYKIILKNVREAFRENYD